MLPDLESVDELVREVLGRAEGVIYTIADAAVSSSDAVAAGQGSKQSADWLSGITNTLESVLKVSGYRDYGVLDGFDVV